MSGPEKKHFISGHEHYQAKRWEGKPLNFKLKYAVANFPEFLFSAAVICIAGPLFYTYKYLTYEDSKKYAISKFRFKYTVVRDDDPNLEEINKEKEYLRRFFPI